MHTNDINKYFCKKLESIKCFICRVLGYFNTFLIIT